MKHADQPTVWVPHSYPACSQHAPNEHVPAPLMRQGLAMTAALLWAGGEQADDLPRRVPTPALATPA